MCICTYVCMYVYVCMWAHVFVCVCACMWRLEYNLGCPYRSTIHLYLSLSLSLWLNLSLVWNLSIVLGQKVPRIHLFLPLQCWDHMCKTPNMDFECGFWGQNFGHYACKARTLLTELPSQHRPSFKKQSSLNNLWSKLKHSHAQTFEISCIENG